jgi:hypothetical protein
VGLGVVMGADTTGYDGFCAGSFIWDPATASGSCGGGGGGGGNRLGAANAGGGSTLRWRWQPAELLAQVPHPSIVLFGDHLCVAGRLRVNIEKPDEVFILVHNLRRDFFARQFCKKCSYPYLLY